MRDPTNKASVWYRMLRGIRSPTVAVTPALLNDQPHRLRQRDAGHQGRIHHDHLS